MARTGKIARLPQEVRERLNRRLHEGQPGPELIAWLNKLPDVVAVLRDLFHGQPVNEQNLSEWRQGGYQYWLRHQDQLALARDLAEAAEDLAPPAGGPPYSDQLAMRLTLVLTSLAAALIEEADIKPAERWRRFRELAAVLSQLRRDDHRAAQAAAELAGETAEESRWKTRMILQLLAPQHLAQTTKALGGGALARQRAALLTELQCELAPGTLLDHLPPEPGEETNPRER